jgi:hypothetical protein
MSFSWMGWLGSSGLLQLGLQFLLQFDAVTV